MQKTAGKNNDRVFLLNQCNKSFLSSRHRGAASMQMFMHDFYDKSLELKVFSTTTKMS